MSDAPQRFRKKPVVIEAMCLSRENADDVLDWICENEGHAELVYGPTAGWLGVAIFTLEGTMQADPGDWIIRGVKGEFYPCKPDIFEVTYEPAAGLGSPDQ